MKRLPNNTYLIGVDHGYGNMKGANVCFPTGIMAYDSEPLFTRNLLVFENKYYLIGEGHKEFLPNKALDEDYYILTLATISEELRRENITDADVFIAAGLPLTWTTGGKKEFEGYLTRKPEVSFTYKKVDYHLRIVGAKIYPQGYAAVAPNVAKMDGVNLICDIGNGTMNLLYIVDGMPETSRMFTEKYGTYQCTLMVRERFLQKTQREIPDAIIEKVLRTSTADIPKADLQLITEIAETYAEGILRRLREHGYDGNTMKLIVTGGGGCLLSNFGKAPASVVKAKRIIRQHDICAAAKGYEYLAELQLRAGK